MKLIGLIGLFSLFFLSCSKVKTVEEETDGRLLEIYTNYPGIKPAGHRPPEFDIKLAQLIDNARKEVYWAMYGFYRTSIKDSVLRAVQRGLDVQLAGDAGTYSYGEVGYIQFEDLLRRYPNAKLIAGNSQSIQHNKFCVIDRRYVMTGTGNITDSEIDRNYNVWTIIESKELAEDFINEHQQMMAGRFGHAKDRPDNNNVFSVGGVKVEAYFSPHEDAMSQFLQAVSQAQSNIYFAIFAFTHDQLGRMFVQKHKQFTAAGNSTAVRGIMDRSQLTHNQYVEVYRLATACGHTYGFEAGGAAVNGGTTSPFTASWDTPAQANTRCYSPLDMRIDGNENNNYVGDWQAGGGRLHAKTIVVDAGTPNAKLMLGSFNWSPNANNNNDENLIIIHSPAIVERYLQFWRQIYDEGIPMNKRYPTNQEMQQGIVTYQPRETGDYQKIVISEVNYAGTTRKIGSTYFAYDGNEFIELYNPGNSAVDVSFWGLYFPIADNYTDPGVYTSGFPDNEALAKRGVVGLPGGTIIPAKGFLVVTKSDQRNDITADGYDFPASVLYDPANSASFQNKITYYNPANNLSNFFSLFERRSSSTGRTSGTVTGGVLTFEFLPFADTGKCRSAWDVIVDRFTGSNYFNPYHMHAGTQTGYPHLTSLWVELRDNRGNLVDIVGRNRRNAGAAITNGISAATTSHDDLGYFAGGFHLNVMRTPTGTTTSGNSLVTGMVSTTGITIGMFVEGTGIPTSTTVTAVAANQITLSANATASGTITLRVYQNTLPATRNTAGSGYPNIATNTFPLGTGTVATDNICDVSEANMTVSMVSMERANTLADGTNPASWEHATLTGPRTTNIGTYIKAAYKERTIATPGEINSRWTALP